MPDAQRHVVLDSETTGLLLSHQITEVAWWDLGDDAHGVFVPKHNLNGADPVALTVSRYHERLAHQPQDDGTLVRALHQRLGGDGVPTALITANPAFDVRFLLAMFGRAGLDEHPFHHRPFDVEEGAYWLYPDAFEHHTKPGLHKVAALLGVPMPNHHEAMADVEATVVIWRALQAQRESLRASRAVCA